jgi:hypothetical protein
MYIEMSKCITKGISRSLQIHSVENECITLTEMNSLRFAWQTYTVLFNLRIILVSIGCWTCSNVLMCQTIEGECY